MSSGQRGITRAIPVVHVADRSAAHAFYVEFLGFEIAMDRDGMLMLRSATVPTTQVIATWPSPTAEDPHVATVDLSVDVDDVDAALRDAQAAGLEIVYPITDEPWGIRRFFVRDPSGRVVNVAMHLPAPYASGFARELP